jgi:hypothetical protein
MAAPLAELYTNTGGFANRYNLTYPETLPDTSINHYILFSIFETKTNIETSAAENNTTAAEDFTGTVSVAQTQVSENGEVANLAQTSTTRIFCKNKNNR